MGLDCRSPPLEEAAQALKALGHTLFQTLCWRSFGKTKFNPTVFAVRVEPQFRRRCGHKNLRRWWQTRTDHYRSTGHFMYFAQVPVAGV